MLVLALDQGTTSSRAILFDREGSVCGVAQKEFRQIFPQPGWVEHDPEEIWTTQRDVAREVLASQGVSANEVTAIGITNQRETTVVWERETGRPVGNAIVWQDRRTADICDRLKRDGHEELLREKTGLLADPYFSGTKLQWMLENIEGLRARAERGELCFGTVDAWLVYRLTNGARHVTDPSNASRTLLYDIRAGDWDDELLGLFGVPRSMLPELRSSSEVYAETAPEVLGAPVRIAGIAGDQQAALFGQMCREPGMVKNTYGTGCFMLLNTGERAVPSKNGLLTTVAWRLGDVTHYALEGSVFIGGALVQWLRDGLGLIESASEIESLAASVKDSDGVVIVPAFVGLGAPHWDPYARGTIVGLTRGTTKAHIARAALDAIALQVADVLEAMSADSGLDASELRVDGGAAANDLLLQTQADLLGVPVVRPAVLETTALGAAYLAGLAVGYFEGLDAIREQWRETARFTPRLTRDEARSRSRLWRRAVERARGWAE